MANNTSKPNSGITSADAKVAEQVRNQYAAMEIAARSLAKDMKYVLENLKESSSILDKQAGMFKDISKSSQLLNYAAKSNANIAKDVAALYDAEVQSRSNLLLKQNMLTQGLQGEYAQLLTTYMLENDITDVNDRKAKLFVKELQERQTIARKIEDELDLIEELATWQEGLNHELEEYAKGWEKIKSKIKAIVTDPQVAKAVFLTSMAKKAEEVYESFEKLEQSGLTVGQRVDYMAKGFSLMSAVGLSDTKGVLDEMVATMGTMNSLTSAEVDHVGHLAKEMGVTGQEAFGLVEGFSKLPGETMATATHAADYVKSLSKANGVAPGKITKEIAKNTELMALGGYKSAKAFTEAAMKAQKMGVELSTTSRVMNGLLNFENSINKQMEASVLLGKEINLDRARQLALEGKSVEATEEVLKNVGGQAAFDKMNVLQKQALAEATGMTVEELNKAADAQAEKNKYSGEEAGLLKNSLGVMMEYGGAGVKLMNESGMAVLAAIQLIQTLNLKKVAGYLADKAHGVWEKVSSIWRTADKTKEIAQENALAASKQRSAAADKMKGGGMMGGMNAGSLLKGAAAMVIMAGALYLLGKAVQQFADIDWTTMSKAGAALLGLGLAMIGLNYALAPLAASGILELTALSLLAFGAAALMLGVGIGFAAEGMSLLVTSLKDVPFENLVALPLAFMGIGAGLYLMAAAGLAALPILGALTALAVVAPALSGLGAAFGKISGGGESDESDPVVKALEALGTKIDQLAAQPVIVNIDGSKVGEAVRLKLKPSFGTKQA
jgi:hypothetical protein